MKVKLAYGKKGVVLHLDDEYNIDIIEPRYYFGVLNWGDVWQCVAGD